MQPCQNPLFVLPSTFLCPENGLSPGLCHLSLLPVKARGTSQGAHSQHEKLRFLNLCSLQETAQQSRRFGDNPEDQAPFWCGGLVSPLPAHLTLPSTRLLWFEINSFILHNNTNSNHSNNHTDLQGPGRVNSSSGPGQRSTDAGIPAPKRKSSQLCFPAVGICCPGYGSQAVPAVPTWPGWAGIPLQRCQAALAPGLAHSPGPSPHSTCTARCADHCIWKTFKHSL